LTCISKGLCSQSTCRQPRLPRGALEVPSWPVHPLPRTHHTLSVLREPLDPLSCLRASARGAGRVGGVVAFGRRIEERCRPDAAPAMRFPSTPRYSCPRDLGSCSMLPCRPTAHLLASTPLVLCGEAARMRFVMSPTAIARFNSWRPGISSRYDPCTWAVACAPQRLSPVCVLPKHTAQSCSSHLLVHGYLVYKNPYRGTSLMRNRHPIGPYNRTMPRALWGS